jgi:erythromycin esterase-like protein
VDPEAAERARDRYACFDGSANREYGYAEAMGLKESCEQAALEQLLELQRMRAEYAAQDGRIARARQFYAEQNAKLVKDAEAYYRAMYRGSENTWNLRDTHMADTLDALMTYLSEGPNPAKIVVWAHNSHLGDARATEMGQEGELNLGQLVRERHPGQSFHLGFSTYWGTVTAASRWGASPQHRSVLRALHGSVEELMHEAGRSTNGYLLPHEDRDLEVALAPERLERAIGVIYRPDTERWSHYFHASLSRQFDALVHFDRSFAVEPLDPGPNWSPHPEDAPETFPYGL